MSKRKFLFNIETSYEVTAETEEEAVEIINGDSSDFRVRNSRRMIDRDVMLTEVICMHDGIEDASDCPYREQFPSNHKTTIYSLPDPSASWNLPK